MNSLSIIKTKREDRVVEVNTHRGRAIGKILSIDLPRESCSLEVVWVANPDISEIITTQFKSIHLAKTTKVERFYYDNFELP